MRRQGWLVLVLMLAATGCQSDIPRGMPLCVMTYSIQHAAGGLDRIRAEIAGYEPDILCIQGAKRDAEKNQIAELANHFGYVWADGKVMDIDGGEEVSGILSRYALSRTRVIDMPGDRNIGLVARVAAPSQPIWVVCMALTPNHRVDPIGLTRAETRRGRQAERILEATSDLDAPVIVAGTLNSTPLSGVYRALAGRWTDCHFALDALAPATYPNFIPAFRFDYVFASDQFYPTKAFVSPLGSSDHRAVIVYLYMKAAQTQPSTTAWVPPRAVALERSR